MIEPHEYIAYILNNIAIAGQKSKITQVNTRFQQVLSGMLRQQEARPKPLAL
jgi:hypothetical protein